MQIVMFLTLVILEKKQQKKFTTMLVELKEFRNKKTNSNCNWMVAQAESEIL